MQLTLGYLGDLAGGDLVIIGIIFVVIFNKRLPEVVKNLGRTIMEFVNWLF